VVAVSPSGENHFKVKPLPVAVLAEYVLTPTSVRGKECPIEQHLGPTAGDPGTSTAPTWAATDERVADSATDTFSPR